MSRHQAQAEAAHAARCAHRVVKAAQRLEAMLQANDAAAQADQPLPNGLAGIEACARGLRMDASAAEAAAREAAIYSSRTTHPQGAA